MWNTHIIDSRFVKGTPTIYKSMKVVQLEGIQKGHQPLYIYNLSSSQFLNGVQSYLQLKCKKLSLEFG
jgi:hypothetical protein